MLLIKFRLNSKKTIFISSMNIHDKKNLTLYKKKQFVNFFLITKKALYNSIRLFSWQWNEKNTIYKFYLTKTPRLAFQ